MYTYGYGPDRDNVNPVETYFQASTLATVKPSPTNSPDLKGIVYAQPLYMSGITINGRQKNALFVATEENWVYALDADNVSNAALWSLELNIHNQTTNESAVPDTVLPQACVNIAPEAGITGTPVIDSDGTIMYVVSKHTDNATPPKYSQRLNAIELTTGTLIASLDIGTAITAVGGTFSALNQNQRAGLALGEQSNSLEPFIYVAWASHCDGTPYNGILAAFSYTPASNTLALDSVFYTESSSGSQGGIWMAGAAPAVTGSPESTTYTDLFLASGNGTFTYGQNWGQSVLNLHHDSTGINVKGFYTPQAYDTLNRGTKATNIKLNLPQPSSGTTISVLNDMDLGSGGVTLVRPAGSGFLPTNANFVAVAAGKQGVFYVLNPLAMNNSGADTVDPCSTGTNGQTVQCFGAIHLPTGCCKDDQYGKRGTAAFWGGNTSATSQPNALYVAGSQDIDIRAWTMTVNGHGTFNASAITAMYGFASPPNPLAGQIVYPGSSPVISWNASDTLNGTGNAILWILDTSGAAGTSSTHVDKLYAYSAVPAANQQFAPLWKDETNGPLPTKFMVPTIVNGHVYVAGRSPNGTCAFKSCLGRVVSWH